MDRLTALPDELLNEIVAQTHATSKDSLPALGLTCARLQRLCRAMQWKHIVLPWRINRKAPIASFLEAHIGNEDIQSLRLCPQRAILNAFRINMKSAFDHVDTICHFLSSLPKLDTFSIFLDGQIDRRCALPGHVIARIVRALPPSVRHLELDTECTDEVWDKVTAHHRHPFSTTCTKTHDNPADDPTKHLCHAISEQIPHLETLNLRLSCICTEIFLSLSSRFSSDGTQPTSTLRRALITFDTGVETERHGELHVELRDCLSAPSGHTRYSSAGATTLAKQKVFKHLLDLQADGAFPDLQRFIVFSWNTDAEFPTRYLTVRDAATRTVKKFPKLGEQGFRIRWEGDLEEFQEDTPWLIKDEAGMDWVGSTRRMGRAVLHEVRWSEDKHGGGVRTPPSTSKSRDETVRLKSGELVDIERARQAVDFEKSFPCVGRFERARVVVERL